MFNVILDTNDIIYRIIKTSYVKRGINTVIMILISFILRTIIYSVFSFIFFFNNMYVDFVIQCMLSIILLIESNKFDTITNYFYDDTYKITKYFINNYTLDNYRKWKNYTTFFILLLCFLYFSLFEINSQIIRIYILQYALCYLFMDIKNNEKHIIRKKMQFYNGKINNNVKINNDFKMNNNIKKNNNNIKMNNDIKMPKNISSEFDLIKDIKDIKIQKNSSFEIID